MPPRFVYWTILIDGKPTAFRARDQQELLPTIGQLKRTNQDVVLKWFARGKLWDSPEAERSADRRPSFTGEKRNADWRPGGTHTDPRDRFKKKNRPERAWSDKESPTRRDRDKLGPPSDGEQRPFTPRPASSPPRDADGRGGSRDHRSSAGGWSKRPEGPRKPWSARPDGPRKPWSAKPDGPRKPRSAKPDGPRKPWSAKPDGPRKPWSAKPDGPRKPWSAKPDGPRKPWSAKPDGPRKPWSAKPDGPRKPWSAKPDGPRKPWSAKPDGPRKPWTAKPDGPHKPWSAKPDGPRKPWTAKPPAGGPQRTSPDRRGGQGGSPSPQDRPTGRKPDDPDQK